MTPLEVLICELIATDGPMRLDRYMGLCLGHPQHGYYVTRDPLGAEGDFITAPEVSQVFGELIGIWAAGAYVAMGEPPRVNLVELGPGRGTLMADMLRTIAKVSPGLFAAAALHLVETSPVLRARQRQAVGSRANWHTAIEEEPEAPLTASQKIQRSITQTLSIQPAKRTREKAAVAVLAGGVVLLLGASLWHRGCAARAGAAAVPAAAARPDAGLPAGG